MQSVTPRPARRARAYVRVSGPDAVDYLDRMLSNDVPEEGSVDALLLTPKARVIAPLLVWRRGDDDVLLLTEPELGEVVRGHLTRMRFAARCKWAAASSGDSGASWSRSWIGGNGPLPAGAFCWVGTALSA